MKVDMDKKAIFKELLDQFETQDVRLYCEDMIEHIPDYIFTVWGVGYKFGE